MVVTSRTMGEGGGEEEAIVEFAPLLPLGFRPLMFALYRRLSMGAMGNKGLQGIAKGEPGEIGVFVNPLFMRIEFNFR